MTTAHLSEAERARRTAFVRESKAANLQRQTVEQRAKRREDAADAWAHWLHQKMESSGAASPVEVLPDALAKLEQTIDDRVAAELIELKKALRRPSHEPL
jgi:hypothetical protein